MFAAIRSNDINLPLFLHILGSMLVTGTLLTVVGAMILGWRRAGDNTGLTRLSFKTVLWGLFPAYLLMRLSAQWLESEEGLAEAPNTPVWLIIGYVVADFGALLVLVALVLSAVGLRKLRAGNVGSAQRIGRAVGLISVLLLVAYLIAMWAMSAKPA